MTQLGPILTNAITYWEKRRLPYNLMMLGIVLYLGPTAWLTAKKLSGLFILAVLANICYCAAYLIDVPVQLSEFREGWLGHRWALWALGLGIAAVLTWWTCTIKVL